MDWISTKISPSPPRSILELNVINGQIFFNYFFFLLYQNWSEKVNKAILLRYNLPVFCTYHRN